MGRSVVPPALLELFSPTSPEAQVDALRSLKNEIVGHDQRKEFVVRHGVVKPLAGILTDGARNGGKKRRSARSENGSMVGVEEESMWWSTDDELRFQTTLVVGSLANGGPAFITPLLAGGVLPPLLEALSPEDTHPKLIIATLRALNQIADAITDDKWAEFGRHVFTRAVVESLTEILAQPTDLSVVHQEISLAAKFIVKMRPTGEQSKLLLNGGVVDQLATKLAAMASIDAQALRGEYRTSSRDELPVQYLPDLLEAIADIIKPSNYNIARFIHSQPIQQVFGLPKNGNASAYNDFGLGGPTPWVRLTPRLPTHQSRAEAHETRAAFGSYGDNTFPPLLDPALATGRHVGTDPEPENPLFIWLMYVARQSEGRGRLAACWLLALLKNFSEKWPLDGDTSSKTRDRYFSYLVVPLVVKMIEEANTQSDHIKKNRCESPQLREETMYMLERAPFVLAALIAKNKTLQHAADEARIAVTLGAILKKTFDPIPSSSKQLWSPRPGAPQARDLSIDAASSTLDSPGLGSDVIHAFKTRENALQCLAALSDTEDKFRQTVIDVGAAPNIIASLVPLKDMDLATLRNQSQINTADIGNPDSVLIAACSVSRSLSRSVSVLRTSLIDNGFAQPCFDLLSHPNVKVQIAATEVITNLVLELSPMRSEIIKAGAIKILCEHCRSANFDLRFASIWALKHLILRLSYTTKVECLDELGVGWLVTTLGNENSRAFPTSSSFGLGTSNAAGEQVDILNAMEEPHMDVDEDTSSSSDDEDTMTDTIPGMRRHQRPGSRYTSATNIRNYLQEIKNDEQDSPLNTEREEMRIQEQALDFIRNFTNDTKSSGELIDHLLRVFGHTRFFELLDSKLRPKNSPSTSQSTQQQQPSQSFWTPMSSSTSTLQSQPPRPTTTTSTSQQAQKFSSYPPPEIISATLFILIHLANGRPHHRAQAISQTTLMHHILPLFNHPSANVRRCCVWFVNNLTWKDDGTDAAESRNRALILRDLGFEEATRKLVKDPDMDIKDKAKLGVDQFERLLGAGGSGAAGVGTSAGTSGSRAFGLGGLGSAQGRWSRDGGRDGNAGL